MLFVQARGWKTRPSKLLGIKDKYIAYCLDQAIFYFGTSIDYELEQVDEKNPEGAQHKREQLLRSFLYPEAESQKKHKGQFADPAAMFK